MDGAGELEGSMIYWAHDQTNERGEAMNDIREQIAELHEWGEAYNETNHRASRFFRDTAGTMEKMLTVIEAVIKLGENCRFDADDWVLSPKLTRQYVEPVYQQALAVLKQK